MQRRREEERGSLICLRLCSASSLPFDHATHPAAKKIKNPKNKTIILFLCKEKAKKKKKKPREGEGDELLLRLQLPLSLSTPIPPLLSLSTYTLPHPPPTLPSPTTPLSKSIHRSRIPLLPLLVLLLLSEFNKKSRTRCLF